MVQALRWGLVVPALIFGAVIPGILVQAMWEGGSSLLHWLPVVGAWIQAVQQGIAEAMNSLVSGACAVAFPTLVAPSRHHIVGLASGFVVAVIATALLINGLLLTNYYADVPGLTILWEVINFLLYIGSSAIAGLVAWGTQNSPDDSTNNHVCFNNNVVSGR